MLKAAAAMNAMGVKKGDRVALTGLNSTRYLVLDVAIGLLGAVSVPLYNTSPPAEIDQILKSSGARLFLVGAPSILARLNELKASVQIVSFCRKKCACFNSKISSWNEFLTWVRGSDTRYCSRNTG